MPVTGAMVRHGLANKAERGITRKLLLLQLKQFRKISADTVTCKGHGPHFYEYLDLHGSIRRMGMDLPPSADGRTI